MMATERAPETLADDLFDQLPGMVLGGGYNSEKVTVQLWWPSPSVMVTRVIGHLDAPAARFLATSLRSHLKATRVRLVGFHDWARVTDYDSDARILLTELTREALTRTEGVHVFVQSPLVAFGLRTASTVLPNVHAYQLRAAFDAALSTALRERAPSPSLTPREEPSAPNSGFRTKACSGCGAELPDEVGTAYSLISHGWRLSRPGDAGKPLWHCPACWRSQKRRAL
jgi:hypothetical protein